MHLTMQGVGFTDEVERSEVEKLVEATRRRCADVEPFTVTIGPAHVDPETIQMPVRPTAPLIELRATIRDAIGDVWGLGNVPEPAEGHQPHVSLGYSNSAGPAQPLAAALAEHGEQTAEVVVRAVTLIDLNRDRKAYEWSDVATVPLAEARH
jgi:2'-5' RNA ligase